MLETSVPVTDVRSTRLRRAFVPLAGFAAQGIVIFVLAYMLLGGRSRDMHVPIRFGVDSLAYLVQSKTTLENGWWWSNPRMSAPFTFNLLLFPSNSTVDQALLGAVGLVTRDLGLTMNVTWLLMLALGGVIATYGLRLLGVSAPAAFVMGTLFALNPFGIYRNLEHFMLVTYLVPFSAALAVAICAGTVQDIGRGKRTSLYLGCVLTGLNYAYYALFGCLFLGAATVGGYLAYRRWRLGVAGMIGAGAIVVATGINLMPSLRAWEAEGKPVTIQEKLPAEAEVYGLKVRHLVSPLWGHTLSPLAEWNKRDAWARFPLETENTVARLGIVASIGLICGLGVVLAAARARQTDGGRSALAAGQMLVVGILFATIGGFGTLFNLFVAADIRAYNRIVPFLSFFALLVVAVGCDAVLRRSRVLGSALLMALLVIGLWDQSYAFIGINRQSAQVHQEYRGLQSLVREVEVGLPRGSRVLQLPFTLYLNDYGRARLPTYDQFKPYLVSQHLHWSFPALSNLQFRWEQEAMKVSPGDLPAVMAREGFAAIWVDTYGYDDSGTSILTTFNAAPGVQLRWSDERYSVFDIRAVSPTDGTGITTEPPPATALLTACTTAPVVSIEYIDGKPGPFDVAIPLRSHHDVRVAGWIVPGDKTGVAAGLDAVLDGQLLHAYYGFPRQDVAAHFGSAEYRDAGFVAIVPAALLTPGAHRLSFRAASRAGGCAAETPAITLAVQ
jgi:hypothetical protein